MHERGIGLKIGRSHVTIGDFDGDGRPEPAAETSFVAGWCSDQIYHCDESSLSTPSQFTGRGARFERLPNDSGPVIVTRSAFNPTNGGKATYLTTALATELRVTRWAGPKAETALVLVHGNGW